MNWMTLAWPMAIGACLTMGAIQLRVGLRSKPGTAHLLFALNAFVVAVYSCFELALACADTAASYLSLLRWLDIMAGMQVVTTAAFVWVFFGTGRKWLGLLGPGLTCLALIADLMPQPKLVYLHLTGIRKIETFGGASYMVAEGEGNPLNFVFYLGVLFLVVFVADASITLWRRGARQRAAVVGGAITFFVLFACVQAALVDNGILRTPYLLGFAYLAILVAMGMELSEDTLRATRLASELVESERQMALAAEAANLGVWVRDLGRDEIWASDSWRSLFGFASSERLELDHILQRIHPEDREAIRKTLAIALEKGDSYETDYRIVMPDGKVRHIASRGRVECDSGGRPILVRGVSLDVSAHKQAEQELHERRGELAHLSRVTMLGELSGSLAHELNQPLTAILSNAQAAEHYLAEDKPDLEQVREILADIVSEDERAGEVIRRLRLLLKKGQVDFQSLDPSGIVLEVLKLARSDLTRHGVIVESALAEDLSPVRGDAVQIQQVLLNLVMNACDAMADNDANDRNLTVLTREVDDGVARVEVRDNGRGLPPGGAERAFERYFTTKTHGLGLGLSVCRTIIAAHGGTLGAANNPDRGATFYFTLPLAKGGKA